MSKQDHALKTDQTLMITGEASQFPLPPSVVERAAKPLQAARALLRPTTAMPGTTTEAVEAVIRTVVAAAAISRAAEVEEDTREIDRTDPPLKAVNSNKAAVRTEVASMAVEEEEVREARDEVEEDSRTLGRRAGLVKVEMRVRSGMQAPNLLHLLLPLHRLQTHRTLSKCRSHVDLVAKSGMKCRSGIAGASAMHNPERRKFRGRLTSIQLRQRRQRSKWQGISWTRIRNY